MNKSSKTHGPSKVGRKRHYVPSKNLSPKTLKKRRADNARRKREQMSRQKMETIEDTHLRRQVTLKDRQERSLITLKRNFETKKKEIGQREVSKMKALRKAGKLTKSTDAKNTERHSKQTLRLQARHNQDIANKEELWNAQIEKQRLLQRRQNPNPQEPFTLERTFTKGCKKFLSNIDEFRVVINKPPVEVVDILIGVLNKTVDSRKLIAGDYIRLAFKHDLWTKHISTKGIIITKDTQAQFLTTIAKVLETAEYRDSPIHEIKFTVFSAKSTARCTGRLRPTKFNLTKKRTLIPIINSDSMCAARAVVTAMANLNPNNVRSKSQIKNGFNASRVLQKREALKLHEETGVPIDSNGTALDGLKIFAKHREVQINVIEGDNKNALIYTSDNKFKEGMRIYLFKSDDHYDVIKSMKGFLGRAYYCHECKTPYDTRDKHRCEFKCKACFSGIVGNCEGVPQECPDCNRTFFGKECFVEHKRNRALEGAKPDIVCERVQYCRSCKCTTQELSKHVCGQASCSNCKKVCDLSTHQCFMLNKTCMGGNCEEDPTCEEQGKDLSGMCSRCKTRTDKYICYDVETDQSSGTHVVNLVVAHDFNGEKFMFENINDLVDLALSPRCAGYTFIAHNAKAFDNYFVLCRLLELGVQPEVTKSGSKIMRIMTKQNNLTFLDSFNHIQSPLSLFPKTFGLDEMKKGYFPHLFNISENQNYIGKIPDTKFYTPQYMSTKARNAFLKWHKAKVDEDFVFDFYKEFRAYCESDVDILLRGMKSYRELFLKIANVDPLQYITIASVVLDIFRELFLRVGDIAVVRDVSTHENFTRESIGWLDWIAEREDIEIQHALSGGIQNEEVAGFDGFCESTNTVYEYQGCVWHGCSTCYYPETVNPFNQVKMGELRKNTMHANKEIQNLGYKLVTVRECEHSKEFVKWFKEDSREFVGPLDPRDAFFGGRTNTIKLLYKFKPGEKGMYVDFCSLYPFTQFEKEYPIGHPTKILEPLGLDPNLFGYVKCTVVPPRELYHPVLPVKMQCGKFKKLLFPLCRTCANTQQQEKCTHTDGERSFLGTWCSNEIHKAVEKGYKVTKVYETWHFEETTTDLFKGYVNKFLKIKLESSKMSFGPGCAYASEDEFRDFNKKKHGFTLGEIKFNPGLRAISKLCLNSLWGKFGQRTNLSKTKYVTDLKEFWEIILDDKIEDLDIVPINEEMVEMTYTLKDQFIDNFSRTNIFIATFTTSHARETLYNLLDTVGDAVLSFDTDSCIYVERPDQKFEIKTGEALGGLTDELDGDYFVKWASDGPKSRYTETSKGVKESKCKGFTLNHENAQKINFETMSQLIKGKIAVITTERKNAITRDAKAVKIVNKDQTKSLSYNYNKRVVQENYDTVPYGF